MNKRKLEFRIITEKTTRSFIATDVSCSWNKEVCQIPFSNNASIQSFGVDANDNLYDRSAAISLGLSEIVDNRKVYTASVVLFLAEMKYGEWHSVVFTDAANSNTVELSGSIMCQHLIQFDPTTPTHTDVLLQYERGLEIYKRGMLAFLASFRLTHPELKDLDLITYMNRNGFCYPGYTFMSVSKNKRISPHVLEYLLNMACFHADISGDDVTRMVQDIVNEEGEWKMYLSALTDLILNACCIVSNLLNYDFDYAVDRKGLKKAVERFSMLLTKIMKKGASQQDCEEMATLCTLICFEMKIADIDGVEDTFPLLFRIKPLLKNAFIADVLMLVEAPNVDAATKQKVKELMGHMAGIYRVVEDGEEITELVLAPSVDRPSTRVHMLEGTGPTSSDLRQLDDETRRIQSELDERLKKTPLGCWSQRRNLSTREIKLHNTAESINKFYLVLDQYFPIYEKEEDGCSFVSLNDEGKRGTPVPDVVLPHSGAKMVRAPSFPKEYLPALKTVMKYKFPENELAIEQLKHESVQRCLEINARLKKSVMPLPLNYMFVSLTYDYDKILNCEWESIIRWIADQPDILQADLRLFGRICKVSVVILKIIFK